MRWKNLLAMAAICIAAVSSTANAASLFFDFGDAGAAWATPSSANYNAINVNPVDPANLILFNTLDSSGALTGIAVEASGFYTGANYNGTTTPSGDAAAIFHPRALNDNAFGSVGLFNGISTPKGLVVFSNLDASGNSSYTFTVFGSRTGVADNRETQYDATGANSGVAYLNTSNNHSNVVTIAGIVPDANGEITFEASPGPNNNNASKFWYLGAIRLESTTSVVPEPSTVAIFAFSALAAIIRRSRQ